MAIARRAAVKIAVMSVLASGIVGCSSPKPTGVVMTVDLAQVGVALPADFLGLSFEASVLGSDLFDPARSNLPMLLRDLGTGRLRFGGNSVDRVAGWTADPATPLPSWARSRVDAADLTRLGALAGATGWKIDLAVTLGHPDAAAAAEEVADAAGLIGNGLGSVEIGNEPDLLGSVRPGYDEAGYRADIASYVAAIAAARRGAPLSGPDTADPAVLASYAADERTGLSFLTQHFYPMTRCGGSKPTIHQLLSASTLDTEGRVAGAAVAAGRASGLPVRLDETNSASCGGQDGVSNTLASAFWMVEYLVTAAEHGVAGVGVQGGLAACRGYTPLCSPGADGAAAGTAPGIDAVADASLGAGVPKDGRLAAQPDFYGLLLVHELEGGRWLPLSTDRAAPIWGAALRMPDGDVRVVIVNPSPTAASDITLRTFHRGGRASVQWMTGPSITATTSVKLGGSSVGADGTWRPGPNTPLTVGSGGIGIHVQAATAALVTVSDRG